ncbi:MAG: deoxyribodipyrimidine photo-lyase, partial [Daejeonella sp.]
QIFTNHDYEPYARERDSNLKEFFASKNIEFHTYKDQVIFEKTEILKSDENPYTVFTPYKRKWLEKLKEFYLKSYPTKKFFKNFYPTEEFSLPTFEQIGFEKSSIEFPDKNYRNIIEDYKQKRNYPSIEGTSRISVHLRFGTVSIRKLAKDAWKAKEQTWLNELIWRDFYFMILWHFPQTVDHAFKSQYDHINWRNNQEEFQAWCEGKTGYPIVDAGMRQLNASGFMHNRVRMITASFLSKHLLIDWRWGEAYFARKLLDYEQASNIGGWQWAAGCGNDAAPYFRVFSPELQTKKFDPDLKYVKKWVPEFSDPFKYPQPIVEHKFARERVLKAFKDALSK